MAVCIPPPPSFLLSSLSLLLPPLFAVLYPTDPPSPIYISKLSSNLLLHSKPHQPYERFDLKILKFCSNRKFKSLIFSVAPRDAVLGLYMGPSVRLNI